MCHLIGTAASPRSDLFFIIVLEEAGPLCFETEEMLTYSDYFYKLMVEMFAYEIFACSLTCCCKALNELPLMEKVQLSARV